MNFVERNENEFLDKINIIPLEDKVLVELTGALVEEGTCAYFYRNVMRRPMDESFWYNIG